MASRLALRAKSIAHPETTKCPQKVKIYGKVIFFIIAGSWCLREIIILSQQYFQYQTITQWKVNYKPTLVPPNFSLCFDIMKFINTSKLLSKYPKVSEAILKQREANEDIKNWTLDRILAEYEISYKPVYEQLSVIQIAELMLPFEMVLAKCKYLTTKLTLAPCDVRYFHRYFFNCLYCFEFKWSTHDRLNMTSPQFSSDGIRAPGYHVLRLFNIHLNLKDFPYVNQIITMAHHPYRVPWIDESELSKYRVDNNTRIVYEITYSESTRFNLRFPYRTNCTDPPVGTVSEINRCWHDCAIIGFYNQTNFYPRYTVIRDFSDGKILDSYYKREMYSGLIAEINSRCLALCGRSECVEKHFQLEAMYSLSRPLKSGKYVTIHYSPPVTYETQIAMLPDFPFNYYITTVQTLISFFFGVNYHSTVFFLIDISFKWFVRIYLRLNSSKCKKKSLKSLKWKKVWAQARHIPTKYYSQTPLIQKLKRDLKI